MGCCWSEETDSEDGRVDGYSRVDNNNSRSTTNSSCGSSWRTISSSGSDTDVRDQAWQPLHHQQWVHSSNSWSQPGGVLGGNLVTPGYARRYIDEEEEEEEYDDEEEKISRSSHHNEERQFFQLFFSVMDHAPGHQGILRRWEREDQWAECENAGRVRMGKVWLVKCGYVGSLQRVKLAVSDKWFVRADHERLSELAEKVVKRRTVEYNAAEAKGKADSKHLKVLQEWRGVKNTLQNLL